MVFHLAFQVHYQMETDFAVLNKILEAEKGRHFSRENVSSLFMILMKCISLLSYTCIILNKLSSSNSLRNFDLKLIWTCVSYYGLLIFWWFKTKEQLHKVTWGNANNCFLVQKFWHEKDQKSCKQNLICQDKKIYGYNAAF